MSSPTSSYSNSPADLKVDLATTGDELTFDSLLEYSQHPIAGHFAPILWDLREPPLTSACLAIHPEKPILRRYLRRTATAPPTVVLNISCDLFNEDWHIEARRLDGVTIGDVLSAIHAAVMVPIRRHEWDALSDKQKKKVEMAFDARCNMNVDREKCRSQGVLRVDILLHHNMFAGLSVSPDVDCGCVLTLRRQQ